MDTSIHYTYLTEAELATIDGGAPFLTRQNSSFKHGIFLYNSGRDFGRSIINGIMH